MSSDGCPGGLMYFSFSKKMLYLGREYPKGSAYFRERLKAAFLKNKDVTDPEKIRKLVARGDFVIKELEALYFLRKYRAMKKRYYEPEKWLTHSTIWTICDEMQVCEASAHHPAVLMGRSPYHRNHRRKQGFLEVIHLEESATKNTFNA